MGQLPSLSTRTEIMPSPTPGGVAPTRAVGKMRSAFRRVAAEGLIREAEISVAARVARYAMAVVKDVDDHRRGLAGTDRGLNLPLCEVEVTLAWQIDRIQRGHAYR